MLTPAAANDHSHELSKKQSAWAKPHSVLENLQGSVEKLSLTLNALQGSVELLQPTTKDFTRLKHVMHFQRQYDLISEKDIKSAQSQIAQDIRPQIDTLLSEAESVMAKLLSEEQTLEATVEKQEEEMKHQQLKVNEKQRLENLHHRAGDEDRSKIDQASAEAIRRLKSLKLKKDGLIRTIEDRAEEIERKEHQLYKLKEDTKRMQQRKQNAASDGTAQDSQYELRKRQLTAELASIELKLDQKKKMIQAKRRTTIGDGIMSESKKSRRRKLVEADLDNTLGNDEPHWKFYPQHLRYIQDVLERICNSPYQGKACIFVNCASSAHTNIRFI
ncbi:Spc19-domain-containing protein [Umbelopsis sp. AD052]|nr:Spc19-domain-containing protein [Umbelopsis sp. AD052]